MTVEPVSDGPDPGEPTTAATVGDGPVVVVVAMALKPAAREALAHQLGPGHVVVDIRDAGDTADIVLTPAVSPQLVGSLRAQFPAAKILITELTDDEHGADFAGPVTRSIASGVDGYFTVPTLQGLASVTRQSSNSRTVAGAIGQRGAPGSGPGEVRELAQTVPSALPPLPVRVDLQTWADQIGATPAALAPLAWPMLMQLCQQSAVTVVGLPPEWISRAESAGMKTHFSG